MDRDEKERDLEHVQTVIKAKENALCVLRGLRQLIAETALDAACALGDDSLEAADDVLQALARALEANEVKALHALRDLAREQLQARKVARPDQLAAIMDILVEKATMPTVKAAVARGDFDVAGQIVGDAFTDALIGLGDDLGDVRRALGKTVADLEAVRPMSQKAAASFFFSSQLDSVDEAEKALRPLFQAAGMTKAQIDRLTDVFRKRRKK